ncbi:MAG: hypothetical protein CMK00_01670 [Planctomycetes bacterium]|jgi:biopolymer transport protein ExbD|nr:hypothetical protein [Planctomycetota bacterium]HJO27371.1 biopolymer transporter ExbD [Planctomycetota bacterium]
MNLSKHDPETEMEMNMTPMIDVVFLLIIFFMIITDMSQADLEELTLPTASNAKEDKPDADDFRPVINIHIDGRMIAKREVLYDPEDDDDYKKLKAYLGDVSAMMEKEHFNKEEGTGPLIPGEALLIRADENTPFKYIQKAMEFCGLQDVQIWKVQLAASESEDKDKE